MQTYRVQLQSASRCVLTDMSCLPMLPTETFALALLAYWFKAQHMYMPVNTKQTKGEVYAVRRHNESRFLQVHLEAARDDSAGQYCTRHYTAVAPNLCLAQHGQSGSQASHLYDPWASLQLLNAKRKDYSN